MEIAMVGRLKKCCQQCCANTSRVADAALVVMIDGLANRHGQEGKADFMIRP